jgi:hypothetical protein
MYTHTHDMSIHNFGSRFRKKMILVTNWCENSIELHMKRGSEKILRVRELISTSKSMISVL